MNRILVTGAGGFIGMNLCQYLAEKQHHVIGVDIHYPEVHSLTEKTNVQLHEVDFRNMDHMSKLLKDIDFVIHLASAHLQISLSQDEYWDINVYSLRPLLELSRKSGVNRFLHVSSVGVYGQLSQIPATEQTECRPQSIYGETKVAGEKAVMEFYEETGFPIVVLRPAWAFGPMCPRTMKLYRSLKKDRFAMIGKGVNLRHPIYILDLLHGVELAMEKNEAVGEIFLFAGAQPIKTHELIETFAIEMGFRKPWIHIPYWAGLQLARSVEVLFKLLDKEPPVSRRTLEFFDTHNAFSIEKAKTLLGFNPQYTFSEGLRNCKEWLDMYA
jgi:nucleoside-diphosphate-sugar epimerase